VEPLFISLLKSAQRRGERIYLPQHTIKHTLIRISETTQEYSQSKAVTSAPIVMTVWVLSFTESKQDIGLVNTRAITEETADDWTLTKEKTDSGIEWRLERL
jgi:hypothetical protein